MSFSFRVPGVGILRRTLRRVGEDLMPTAAASYRAARDAAWLARQTPRRISDGFLFAGNRSMLTGVFERDERPAIELLLKDAPVFVDVGANIGFYTCLARSRDRHVVAFEPAPTSVAMLLKNLQANGWTDVEVFPVGLGRTTSLVTLFGAGGGASTLEGWNTASTRFTQTIPLVALDDVLGHRFSGQRLAIKVDVEGAEYALLEGAVATLKRDPPPHWFMEIYPYTGHSRRRNPYFMACFERFWEAGYCAIGVTASGLVHVDRTRIESWNTRADEPTCVNFVFLPQVDGDELAEPRHD